MINLNLDIIITVFGIIGTLLSGAVWVLILVSRISTRLTQEKNRIDNIQKEYELIREKNASLKDSFLREKEINEAFRHKHKTSVDSLFEFIKIRFDDFDKSFKQFEKSVDLKIDLAISKSENKKK